MNTQVTEKPLSAEAFEQLTEGVNQIATDMNSIKALLDEHAANGSFDHFCAGIELLANRSGALADRIAKSIGHHQVMGDLEEWFG